ncbi:MAG: ABC transporter ATP-binding protein [Oscillospiraceae bacterium]|nr:ABC transporter ATP-binding protein [Oscillospiraceae bacterium]
MKKLLQLLKPYRKKLIGVALIDGIGMLCSLFMPFVMSQIVEKGISAQNITLVWQYAGIMVLLAIICAGANILSAKLNTAVSAGYSADLCRSTFEKINALSYTDYTKIGPSGLLTRATDDIWNVEGTITSLPYTLFTVPVMFIGSAVLAFLADPVLSAVFLLSVPPIFILVMILMRPLDSMWDKSDKYVDMQNKIVRERLSGLRVVRAFNNEDREHGRAKFATEEMAKYMIRANTRGGMVDPFAMLLLNLATVAVIYFGGVRAQLGSGITTGGVIAVLQYIGMISGALISISWTLAWLPKVKVSMRRLNEIHASPDEETIPEGDGKRPDGFEIRIEDLSFAYPNSTKNVLEDLSLTVREGETVALIGGTGSGKSTLIKLLAGLFEPGAGQISIGGVSYRDMRKADIRRHFSVALQKAQIFEGTVRDNIKMGDPTACDDKIYKTLRLSKMAEFVDAHPEGLDYILVGSGQNVSGGQRQRLNMARTVIKEADIYIFDDSFSALDFLTESQIRENYASLLEGKSQIVATQRISTAMGADRIYVMDKGRVIGVGTHSQLMSSCPIYREIAQSQLGGRKEASHEA